MFEATPHPSAIRTQDSHHTDISYITNGNTNEKLTTLNVNGDLKLSVLAGMVELDGAAKFLGEKKDSFKSVESALVCKVTTVMEKLDVWRDDVNKCISEDALRHPTATHVVVHIQWGANCTIRFRERNSDNKEKKEVEGWLNPKLQKMLWFIWSKMGEELSLTKQDWMSLENLSLKIFGDVLPDELPTTVDGAMEMIKNLPQLIQKSNNGKGKPLEYVLFPLSAPIFQNNFGISIRKSRAVPIIDEGQILQSILIYDRILERIQKAHDQVEEMAVRRNFVTESELDEAGSIAERLEEQEGSFRSDLQKVVIALRSGNSDSSAIPDLCTKNWNEVNEAFKKCQKIFNAMRSRIKSEEHKQPHLLHKDVTEELEAKDMAKCSGTARRADCDSEASSDCKGDYRHNVILNNFRSQIY